MADESDEKPMPTVSETNPGPPLAASLVSIVAAVLELLDDPDPAVRAVGARIADCIACNGPGGARISCRSCPKLPPRVD